MRLRWSHYDPSSSTHRATIIIIFGGSLKREGRHPDDTLVTSCTVSCLNDNAVFPAQNLTNQQTNKTCFALIMHLLSIRATRSWKMLMNNEFRADTSTGNPTGNSHCHTLVSRALNMSCSFGLSARSIESSCVVIATDANPAPVQCDIQMNE